jgi:pantetheine-phosphate adenylyltransferase
MPKVAIYPGSFDPVTNGHLDILQRGMKLFDKIIVAILTNPGKNFLFTLEERIEMLEVSIKKFSNVEIGTFDGLTVDYAAKRNAQAILRGLRALSDFEYEFQMALMNRRLNREVQTIFLMTGMRWIYTSSSIIKEAAEFGGSITGMVPPVVEKRIKEKYAVNRVWRQYYWHGAAGGGEANQGEVCSKILAWIKFPVSGAYNIWQR